MKVPFGDLKAHYNAYKQPIDEAVQRTLASGHYILGGELERFEHEFAAYLGAKYVVGCASGTEAIFLALAALNVVPGDEVLVVSHTAVPTNLAISMTGATPVFVDIDPKTYVMDVAKVEAAITAKTRAIIPVHLYGQIVEMNPLKEIAARHNLPIIEDVAQATGATYQGVKAGTMTEFGAFSFYPSKNLGAFGDGGAITTNSKESYERLLMLRNLGQSKRYYHDIVGVNSRLDEIQAAILGAQLPHLDQWNERRRAIGHRYTQGLKDVVTTPTDLPHAPHVYHLYVIQVDKRDELQQYLTGKDIQTLIHFPIPSHLQKAYAFLGYKKGDLPHTEHIAGRIVSLPMFPELTDQQVDYVIDAITAFQKTQPSSSFATASPQLATQKS